MCEICNMQVQAKNIITHTLNANMLCTHNKLQMCEVTDTTLYVYIVLLIHSFLSVGFHFTFV